MLKLKDLITEKSDRKEYERAYLKKIPLNRLRNSRAAVANRMTARWYGMDAHEYLTMHDDELKRRGELTEVSRLDEAPSEAMISAALDAIRSEVRHKDPDIQRWLHPHLRKIDNALRKFKRSGS